MTLSALIKKGALRGSATAIPATAATDEGKKSGTVARVATVAVANPESRELAVVEELPPRAWVAEEIRDGEKLKSVKLCSAVLEDHLWLILDRSFEPRDGLAIYYPEELPILRTKPTEELRGIHKVKLVFPGCRVIQEGPQK
jgi:hypothetical protein